MAAIGDKTPIQATFDDGYRALVLAEAAIASANTGNAVKVEAIG